MNVGAKEKPIFRVIVVFAAVGVDMCSL